MSAARAATSQIPDGAQLHTGVLIRGTEARDLATDVKCPGFQRHDIYPARFAARLHVYH